MEILLSLRLSCTYLTTGLPLAYHWLPQGLPGRMPPTAQHGFGRELEAALVPERPIAPGRSFVKFR
jgi:hypothetical protein